MGACNSLQNENNAKIQRTQTKYKYIFPAPPQLPPQPAKQHKERVADDEKLEEEFESFETDDEFDDRVCHEPMVVADVVNAAGQSINAAEQLTTDTPKASKFPGRKVGIIGAGPAGIHMATLLIKQGYMADQIVLLEKTNRPCGKSKTLPDPDQAGADQKEGNDYDGHEIVHELGTCYLHPEYHAIGRLLTEYDPENEQLGVPSRSVFGTNLNEEHEKKGAESTESSSAVNYTDWALGEIKDLNVKSVPKAFERLPTLITSGLTFERAIDKYINTHQEIFGKQSSYVSYLSNKIQKQSPIRGFPGRPSKENLERLNCTFLEFLEKEDMRSLIPFFVYSQSVQGYGILDKIPAFYGLFWNTPELMRTSADILRLSRDDPNVLVLTKGYQHLWEMMIAKDQLNVVYNCEVTKLDRHLADKNAKTEIWYTQSEASGAGDDDGKEEKAPETTKIEVDILFLACGCKKALQQFWTDATQQEKEVFGPLNPHTLCATLFEFDAAPELETHQTVVDIWPNICWKGNGMVYAHRNSAKCLMGHDKYNRLVKEGKLKRDRGVSYQFFNRPPNMDEDPKNLEHQLVECLEVWGEKNVKLVHQECWDYMPMWEQPELQKFYPWVVKDEMQGRTKNTFYIGSSVCFESVLNVVEYNYEICNLYHFDTDGIFFCKPRNISTGDPPFK